VIKKSNKTTEKDFQVFKKECEYWIKYFGMYEYCVTFFHVKREGLAATQVNNDRSEHMAQMILSTHWGFDEVSHKMLCRSAFHEALELLTWELGDSVSKIHGAWFERDQIHKLIMRLQNTIFEESYQRRYCATARKRY
jgi:hypothetical protein